MNGLFPEVDRLTLVACLTQHHGSRQHVVDSWFLKGHPQVAWKFSTSAEDTFMMYFLRIHHVSMMYFLCVHGIWSCLLVPVVSLACGDTLHRAM